MNESCPRQHGLPFRFALPLKLTAILLAPLASQAAITGVNEIGLAGDAPAIIVSAGFGEEALTFSDRTHQHNGAAFDVGGVLSTTGTNIVPLPVYLVGGDYVRFANDARENAGYSATVTTDVPSDFYILVDNRVNGPALDASSSNTTDPDLGGNLQWIIDGGWERVNTGISPNGQADYTGVDESGDGVGAGVALNQFYAVYKSSAPATNATIGNNATTGSNMVALVAVPAPDPGEPIQAFSAVPQTIVPGGTANLRWLIHPDATVGEIDFGVADILDDTDDQGSGNIDVMPELPTTYTLTVDSPGGNDTATATVDVSLIASFSAQPATIDLGQNSTLSWHVRSDAAVSITPDPGPISTVNGMGSVDVSPASSTTYTLTASAGGDEEMATATVLVLAPSGGSFADPPGGWDCQYDGGTDPLTIGWDHDNGSDEFDGTTIGAGTPGGAGVFDEQGVSFLRMQDSGDPRGNGFPDPGSVRKVFFTKDLTNDLSPGYNPLDQGVTIYFRARVPVPNGTPLDPYNGNAATPWAATGDGYAVHDGGKSTFGIRQASGDMIVSFALSTTLIGSAGGDYSAGEGLTMNKLNGTVPSGDVDATDGAGTPNLLPLEVQNWQDVWITIEADTSGGGTHRADIYVNGSAGATSFHVTAGNGNDEETTYATMGLGATPQSGAVDIDFFNIKEGVHVPAPSGEIRITDFSYDPITTEGSITWTARPGEPYIIFYADNLLDLQSGGDVGDGLMDGDNSDLDPEPGSIRFDFTNPPPISPQRFFSVHPEE